MDNLRMKSFILILFAFVGCVEQSTKNGLFPYQNPRLPVEKRTKDLLSRMTLEEKVGQLLCPMYAWEMYEKQGDSVRPSVKFETLVREQQIGMLWATFRADPWTKKTIATGLNPTLSAKAGNALQRYVLENTRLGIPVFLAEETPHGHMAIGTTVFPTSIGQASTWHPALIEQMSAAIAKEVRLQGGHIGYGPILDLARDPRWSRVEETYGEDPVLIAHMGKAFVAGAGGGQLEKPFSVVSTLKHFTAYGISEGGKNGNAAMVGERELKENFLPPFHAAIDAGALSVMTAYNAVDGIPNTSNRYLLTDVLRGEWGFQGFVVSDLGSIGGLFGGHRVAESLTDAALLAVNAGVDVDLGARPFLNLIEAVKTGKIREAVIDTAVFRVLRLKIAMRLFEQPFVDPEAVKPQVRCMAHINLARQIAQESVVLLKNDKKILPLSRTLTKVAVIGPNADNVYNQLGDYTAPQEEGVVTTVLKGIQAKIGIAKVDYVKGCAIRDTTTAEIDKAVRIARNADVVIAVVGGSSARDFRSEYIDTGAAVSTNESVSDMDNGEGYDRMSLHLLGKQDALISALHATGKPLIIVYIHGRPLLMNNATFCADALLTAWYPGQEGGHAIADVLFGDYNPAGRLPVTIPCHEGQLPVYYNKKNPRGHHYVEMKDTVLYHFGFGLSYTTFEYSQLNIKPIDKQTVQVSLKIKNTGLYDGDEVVQLYLKNEYASVVQPQFQLKHFERVHLKKGEEREVVFILAPADFSIIDLQMKRTVEGGAFTVLVGASSNDIRLREKISIQR